MSKGRESRVCSVCFRNSKEASKPGIERVSGRENGRRWVREETGGGHNL